MREWLIAALLILFVGKEAYYNASPPPVIAEPPSAVAVRYEPRILYREADALALAKMAWGEARGCGEEGIRNVCIVACNRADDDRFPDTVAEVVEQSGQFYGYDPFNPVEPEIYAIAVGVLIDWAQGAEFPGWLYFSGDGVQNYFY